METLSTPTLDHTSVDQVLCHILTNGLTERQMGRQTGSSQTTFVVHVIPSAARGSRYKMPLNKRNVRDRHIQGKGIHGLCFITGSATGLDQME